MEKRARLPLPAAPEQAAAFYLLGLSPLKSGFLVLALLVGNAAAGLAGGLAGSLALAAAAVLGALAQVAGLKSLDSFHNYISIL